MADCTICNFPGSNLAHKFGLQCEISLSNYCEHIKLQRACNVTVISFFICKWLREQKMQLNAWMPFCFCFIFFFFGILLFKNLHCTFHHVLRKTNDLAAGLAREGKLARLAVFSSLVFVEIDVLVLWGVLLNLAFLFLLWKQFLELSKYIYIDISEHTGTGNPSCDSVMITVTFYLRLPKCIYP